MKKLIFGILAALGLAIGYGVYLFQESPPDIRKLQADYNITAEDLAKEFSIHEEGASKKFVDHVLIVSGKVEEIKTEGAELSIVLSSDNPLSAVTCSFYSEESASVKKVRPGMSIKIKGKCTGKLMDVVLNNCSLVDQQN